MSRCAAGCGGQDWDGPHLVVGRLLLGHTVREGVGRRGRQVNMRTASGNASAGLSGQTPPNRSGGLREVFEDLAGDIAFQTADDLGGVESFGSTPGHIGAGFLVAAHAG